MIGAGASITSGIRSAGDLVSSWREDIYSQYKPDEIYTEEKAKEYFCNEHSNWYNPKHEYSSLFERKYDLPRQRRIFIENEVGNKKPFLGYSYLINLVGNNFFNTIFTTNFDDLLNEAFYTFSTLRPIVCAHDSSINSITITSSRPKIIKLHGDYLFDDLKSTVRETESLEINMKNKLVEFSKDYGMIIVGYSGNDRSILEVLTNLLKKTMII